VETGGLLTKVSGGDVGYRRNGGGGKATQLEGGGAKNDRARSGRKHGEQIEYRMKSSALGSGLRHWGKEIKTLRPFPKKRGNRFMTHGEKKVKRNPQWTNSVKRARGYGREASGVD